jgi:hypothetical protein
MKTALLRAAQTERAGPPTRNTRVAGPLRDLAARETSAAVVATWSVVMVSGPWLAEC